MGFFSADLEPMIELYQRETAGLMEEFDAQLAGAVQKNRFAEQDIRAIFRVVHTIKSSAAMMGLPNISECTHRMEDLFLLFRDKPERAQGNENRIFDLMYRFSDYVEKENQRVSEKDFRPGDGTDLLKEIEKEIAYFGADAGGKANAVQGRAEAEPPVQPQPKQAPLPPVSAQSGEIRPWRVWLRPDCQMENVRAFMLVRQIQSLCESITTEPANLEAQDAAAQVRQNGLLLHLRTAHAEEAAKKLSASPYVLRVETAEQHAAGEAQADKQTAREPDAPAGRQNKYSMISWQHVERLQNITGELMTANTILSASFHRLNGSAELENEFLAMKRLFRELEKLVAEVSMTPVSAAAPPYYRLVRDVAAREGKQIRLTVSGEDLEIDRSLLEALANPLIHLLRNAADHGIEPPEVRAAAGKNPCGSITLQFENKTDFIRVTVADDGAGMNTQLLLKKAAERGVLTKSEDQYTTEEILNLAFLPGLTTNEAANQYSGRGVGMDVAQSVVSNLGGSVTVRSEPGKGSAVTMEVPVSVSSAECIQFEVGAYTCLLPIRSVVRIYSFAEVSSRLQTLEGRLWLQTDELMPVVDLFGLYGAQDGITKRLIVIRDARGSAALLAGPVTGQQTAVEKPLPPLLGRAYRTETGIIGCATTGTGKLGMMLNADWLIQMGGKEATRNGNEQQ